jgi:hypothetical protein
MRTVDKNIELFVILYKESPKSIIFVCEKQKKSQSNQHIIYLTKEQLYSYISFPLTIYPLIPVPKTKKFKIFVSIYKYITFEFHLKYNSKWKTPSHYFPVHKPNVKLFIKLTLIT